MYIMEILVNVTEALLLFWLLSSAMPRKEGKNRQVYEILLASGEINHK